MSKHSGQNHHQCGHRGLAVAHFHALCRAYHVACCSHGEAYGKVVFNPEEREDFVPQKSPAETRYEH